MEKVAKITAEKLASLNKKVTAKAKNDDKATAVAIIKKVAERKDLLYKYPADCITLEAKKTFRAKTRKKLKSFAKQINLIEKGKIEGKIADIQKELATFRKANCSNKGKEEKA